MTIMVITDLTVILDITGKIFPYQLFNITAASADYLYSLGFKHILCPLPHISGKHHGDSHLSQHRKAAVAKAESLRC